MDMKLLKVFDHSYKICFAVYVIGLLWFTLLSHHEFSERCYFSENALLPGLVQNTLDSTSSSIKSKNDEMLESTNRKPIDVAFDLFLAAGLDAHKQHFQFEGNILRSNHHAKLTNGTNVYAVVQTARTASTESILINIPLGKKLNYASGVAISLAKLIRGQVHWAKDVVFLFTENGLYGVTAWLNAYHSLPQTNVLQYQPLLRRSGSIQAAIVLDFDKPYFSHLNILTEGFNGQLPNLDLFNLAVRLAHLEGVPAAVNNHFPPKKAISLDSHHSYFLSTLSMMSKQISGKTTGNHGPLLHHKIESITIKSIYKKSYGKKNLFKLARLVEGVCRSLNNLLERLHQSFFFYLLPSVDRYISIGMYMPPLGVLLLVPLLKVLGLAVKVFNLIPSEPAEEDLPCKSADRSTDETADELEIDDILKDIGADFATESPPDKQAELTSFEKSLVMITLSYMVGVGLYYSPYFTQTWSEMFHLDDDVSFVSLLIVIHIAGMLLPSYLRMSDPDKDLSHTLVLIQTIGILAISSVLNFSLSMFLTVWLIGCTLFFRAVQGSRLRHVVDGFVLLASPLAIVVITSLAYSDSGLSIQSVSLPLLQLYHHGFVHGVWTYQFFTLVYYPLWLQYWMLALAPN